MQLEGKGFLIELLNCPTNWECHLLERQYMTENTMKYFVPGVYKDVEVEHETEHINFRFR